MKIHNKLIKSTKVAEKTDSWGDFIITILTRTGLHRRILFPLTHATAWDFLSFVASSFSQTF